MADISINLLGRRFKNPVMVASGTFSKTYEQLFDLSKLGGIVLKSVSAEPRKGNPQPRIMEVSSGTINSIGLENPGIEKFLVDDLPEYLKIGTNIIVSIVGESPDDFSAIANKIEESNLDKTNLAGFELNLSCPNVSGGLDFSTKPELTQETVAKVKAVASIPIIAKLSPNVTDIIPIARAAIEAGADALSLINTVKGMAIELPKRRGGPTALMGGLSGPAIKPVALRFVYEVKKEFADVQVIGIGGISSAEDVLQFFHAGASAVQVGTANFVEPNVTMEIIEGLETMWK